MDPGPCRRVQANALEFKRHLIEYLGSATGWAVDSAALPPCERWRRICWFEDDRDSQWDQHHRALR
jgi:hypothetical protein